jgi:hypothetical protein
MPSSEQGGTTRILGTGVREIDGQLFYSAAWLDDHCQDSESGTLRWAPGTPRNGRAGEQRSRAQGEVLAVVACRTPKEPG